MKGKAPTPQGPKAALPHSLKPRSGAVPLAQALEALNPGGDNHVPNTATGNAAALQRARLDAIQKTGINLGGTAN